MAKVGNEAMIHLTGESKTKIEEALVFGNSIEEIRQSEDYKDFQSDGYTEEGTFELILVSGSENLPGWIAKG